MTEAPFGFTATPNPETASNGPATDSVPVIHILARMHYEEPLQTICLGKYRCRFRKVIGCASAAAVVV